jgi:hypothetical protein
VLCGVIPATLDDMRRRIRRFPVSREAEVFWKIVGIVALVWLAFVVLGALIKGLFPILVISAIVFGLYLLYKAMSSSDAKDVTRTP